MKALVYHGPGAKGWETVPDPEIRDDTDAVVQVDSVTICPTDLHILKGDTPEVASGRILGHEAVGTVVLYWLWRQGARGRRPGPRVVRLGLRPLAGSAGRAVSGSASAGAAGSSGT